MYADHLNKKRGRDDHDDYATAGFGERRTKRRIASLPHRMSPNRNLHASQFGMNYTTQLAPPTLTPAGSDSEDPAAEPRSVLSSYSLSPTLTITPSSSSLDAISSSQSTQISAVDSDMEMSDLIHLSPDSFQSDHSISISGRVPTPIHGSFAYSVRAERATICQDADFADDEARIERFMRGRRLPSPISEGETSPGGIVEGLGDTQMEYEGATQEVEKYTPTKKGHRRSKYSLRSCASSGELGGAGTKKALRMGYRADCEKCRNKVPGHFNHIITYD